jgi:hypothetical protein
MHVQRQAGKEEVFCAAGVVKDELTLQRFALASGMVALASNLRHRTCIGTHFTAMLLPSRGWTIAGGMGAL